MYSGCIFRSFIHLDFIFVCRRKWVSCAFFLPVFVRFFRLCFVHVLHPNNDIVSGMRTYYKIYDACISAEVYFPLWNNLHYNITVKLPINYFNLVLDWGIFHWLKIALSYYLLWLYFLSNWTKKQITESFNRWKYTWGNLLETMISH